MDDEVGSLAGDQVAYALAVPYIEVEVAVARDVIHQVAHHGSSGAGRPEELLPHIVIDADYVPTLASQQARALGADETTRSGDHHFLGDR